VLRIKEKQVISEYSAVIWWNPKQILSDPLISQWRSTKAGRYSDELIFSVLKIISQVIIQGNWVGHWKKLHHRKVSQLGFKNKQKLTKYQTGKPRWPATRKTIHQRVTDCSAWNIHQPTIIAGDRRAILPDNLHVSITSKSIKQRTEIVSIIY
jgi:hypothetical protein